MKEVVPFVQVLNLLVCTRIWEFGSVSELFLTCVSPLSHNFYSLRSSLRASLPKAIYRQHQLSSTTTFLPDNITTTSQPHHNVLRREYFPFLLFRFTSTRPVFGQNRKLRFYNDLRIVNTRPVSESVTKTTTTVFKMTEKCN